VPAIGKLPLLGAQPSIWRPGRASIYAECGAFLCHKAESARILELGELLYATPVLESIASGIFEKMQKALKFEEKRH